MNMSLLTLSLQVACTGLGPLAGPETTAPAAHAEQARALVRDTFAMEAYFSHDGRRIVFQGREKDKPGPLQVFVCDYDHDRRSASRPVAVTDGPSNHECTFFSTDGQYIVYATSEEKAPDESKVDFGGYPYQYDLTKEIWVARLRGTRITGKRRITHNHAYEAETSFSPLLRNIPGRADGVYVLFTSSRAGSLDLWMQRVFDRDGNEVSGPAVQLTNTPTSQEGGSFFLSDHEIVYRTWTFDPKHPNKEQMERDHVNYRPMRIHVMDLRSGLNVPVAAGNARNWAPFPHPSGRKLVFAKRDFTIADHNFDIYVLDLDTAKEERITTDPGFEGYPVFHPAGDTIMFSRYDPASHGFSLWTVPYPLNKGK